MAELLLELFSEEIPARMQARAAEDLTRLVADGLKAAGLAFDSTESHVTPRRLTLAVDGLPTRQEDVIEERKGPRVGAPEQAVQGFMKAAGIDSLDVCEVREDKKGSFYVYAMNKPGRATKEVLPEILTAAFGALPWPKSMRWGAHEGRWVRPLQGILCVFDGAVVPMAFGPCESAGSAAGHRFLAPEPFAVSSFADYKAKLRAAKVMLDAAERRNFIRVEADKLAAAEGLSVEWDEGLLHEVGGLVEWPVVLMGRIDAAFMGLPREVLTTPMKAHQRYFPLLNADGSLAPRFIVVANTETTDGGVAVAAGNERVLRARLADAKFFWDQDRKAPLERRVPRLAERVFHAKLGSDLERVERIRKLAAVLVPFVPGADAATVDRAALLAKADLTTEMVFEFTELQGVMGRYYARHDGESDAVAEAIAEHYSPQGPSDDCPSAPTSIAVALADKIDTLVGFWGIDEKPTGSKDPFALRRAALGVIRLIIENGLRVPLFSAFSAAIESYDMAKNGPEFVEKNKLPDDLLSFFADRLKVHLRGLGVRHDLVSAVFALGGEDDLVRLLARVEALGKFLESEDGADLLTAYRRAANIVRIEEKKDKRSHAGTAETALLRQKEEVVLAEKLLGAESGIAEAVREERFDEAMGILARLRGPVDAFFDNVTVNCDEPELRGNRLRLLSTIRSALHQVADFSKIEG